MNKPERHSSELKSTEVANDDFEFGGHRLSRLGTSGPPVEKSRMADGKPVRAERPNQKERNATAELFRFAGRQLQVSGTSGPASELPRMAEGRPVQRDAVSRTPVPNMASTGSGRLTGGPVRRG